jgi:putrescine transport system ATP-binding protein
VEPLQGRALSVLLSLEGVSKSFGATLALDALSLAVERGEFLALLGGSGSGKSTLLRVIAGFEAPDAGRVLLDGVDQGGVSPPARPCAMVFQNYALFPHLSVFDNVAYGLRREGLPRLDIAARVQQALAMVGLEAMAARRPHQLSGGQRQRVALVRALVKRPPLVLLDEPLGALDAALREATGQELRALQRATGAAFVMVTHDQAEALALADRVAVLEAGRLVQCDPPQELYERPATRFVAGFLGGANVLEGVVGADSLVRCPAAGCALRLVASPEPGAKVSVALRAERITLSAEGEMPAENAATGVLRGVTYQGTGWLCSVALAGGQTLRVQVPADRAVPPPGVPVLLQWPASANIPLVD